MAQEGTLRLAYDPATGKVTTWLNSTKVGEQTIDHRPAKGKFVIFTSRFACQVSDLRVLRGIVPPSADQTEAADAGPTTAHSVKFVNGDLLSANEVLLADGSFVARTGHGELHYSPEEVESIAFATEGQERPRRNKSDVLVETAASRLTFRFDKLTDEYLMGSAAHLGQVKLLRSALRDIRFNIPSVPEGFDISEIKVGPNSTISWEDAVKIIRAGQVKSVSQAHSLNVAIQMADGTTYRTVEPKIDDVWKLIQESGRKDEIQYITE